MQDNLSNLLSNSFFFPNEKERKLCKKKRRRGERGEGGGGLTFFKGIINSLSALVCTFRSGISHQDFLDQLNSLHPNLKFTAE